ncbi:MAG: hypothetical protein ACR2OG_06900 [Gemmatimonadaceae bacterium]
MANQRALHDLASYAVRDAALAAQQCRCVPVVTPDAFFRLTAGGGLDIVVDSARLPRARRAPAWRTDTAWLRRVVLRTVVGLDSGPRAPDVRVAIAPQGDEECR